MTHRLYHESRGRGPDLVLLHGWGMNAAVWRGLPADLAIGHRLTAIELPGHGASPWDPATRGLDDWAQACLAAAPARACWIGWSLGGLVALAAAGLAPERLSGLILLTATPRFAQAADWPAAMAPATLAGFHDDLLADPAGTLQRFLALQVKGSEAARETLRQLRLELAERPAPEPRALAQGLDLLRETDLRPTLPVLNHDNSRLLPESFTGTLLTANEIDGLQVHLGRALGVGQIIFKAHSGILDRRKKIMQAHRHPIGELPPDHRINTLSGVHSFRV